MASTAFALSSFRPLSAGARPKTRNPSRSRRPPQRNPNPNPKSQPKPKPNLKTRIGSEATTYTRLPAKDDEFLPSTLASNIVKLHESTLPAETLTSEEKQPLGFEFEPSSSSDETLGFEWDDSDDDEVVLESGQDSPAEASASISEMEVSEGEAEGDVKEKGVPAVMRCFDRAKIYVKAGNGGNGVVAFRREKFVPYGGPSGGDGGRGGNVYVEVEGSMNSLLPFRKNVHFRAGRGSHGQGSKQAGAKGEDVVVKVAPGTVVREASSGVVLLELMNPGDRGLLLPGGRGGRGNASFKSGSNKVPKIAEIGEEGTEMCGIFPLLVLFSCIFMLFVSLRPCLDIESEKLRFVLG